MADSRKSKRGVTPKNFVPCSSCRRIKPRPEQDLHALCPRCRPCNRQVPCSVCKDWGSADWEAVAAWVRSRSPSGESAASASSGAVSRAKKTTSAGNRSRPRCAATPHPLPWCVRPVSFASQSCRNEAEDCRRKELNFDSSRTLQLSLQLRFMENKHLRIYTKKNHPTNHKRREVTPYNRQRKTICNRRGNYCRRCRINTKKKLIQKHPLSVYNGRP